MQPCIAMLHVVWSDGISPVGVAMVEPTFGQKIFKRILNLKNIQERLGHVGTVHTLKLFISWSLF